METVMLADELVKNVAFRVYCIVAERIAKEAMQNPIKSPLLGQVTYLSTVTSVVSRKTAKIATTIAVLFIFHFC